MASLYIQPVTREQVKVIHAYCVEHSEEMGKLTIPLADMLVEKFGSEFLILNRYSVISLLARMRSLCNRLGEVDLNSEAYHIMLGLTSAVENLRIQMDDPLFNLRSFDILNRMS